MKSTALGGFKKQVGVAFKLNIFSGCDDIWPMVGRDDLGNLSQP